MSKTLILVLYILSSLSICQGQNVVVDPDSFIEKSAKVITLDSQYYLIVNLSIKGKGKISVKEKHFYEEGQASHSDETIEFLKVVRGWTVSIFSNALRQPMYNALDNNSRLKKKIIDQTHPFSDTILLDNYIPLEIGDYFIFLTFMYNYGNKAYWARYDQIPFKVEFIPPKSIYHQ